VEDEGEEDEMREVPYKDIVKENKTLHELQPIDFGNNYLLKTRIKMFTLLNKQGVEYKRGPCISFQLFHNNHFLTALSIPTGREQDLLNRATEATNWIKENG
jgi:hypothetical protein